MIAALGGQGSGNFGHAGCPGRVGGSCQGAERSERSIRALKAFKPAGARIQRHAERNELKVREMIGGERTEGNDPVDIVASVDGHKVGIEVKTLVENTNDKITVRSKALDRKNRWAKVHHAALHTVVLDDRDEFRSKDFSGHKLYHAKGSGSFRLGAMTPVKNQMHLRELLAA